MTLTEAWPSAGALTKLAHLHDSQASRVEPACTLQAPSGMNILLRLDEHSHRDCADDLCTGFQRCDIFLFKKSLQYIQISNSYKTFDSMGHLIFGSVVLQ
jgi:hypothetical protein